MHQTTHHTSPASTHRASSLAPALITRADQPQSWLTHRDAITLDKAREIVGAAVERDGQRSDRIVDLRAFGFGSSDDRTMEIAQVVGEASAPLALRKHAFTQLAARTGMPAAYIATLPAKLQIACVNYAMAHVTEREPALLRLAGNEVRAIMSDRYAPLDDTHLLELVDDALVRTGFRADAMVRSTVHGPHTLLRITIPSGAVEVKKGDVIEYGLDIGNSELGLRSVQVTPMTYRLVCTNGMRSATSEGTTRLRHVGDPLRLRQSLRAVIPTAIAEARGDIDHWKRSVDVLVDSALDAVESLRGFGLAAGESRAVGRRLVNLPESSSTETVTAALKAHRTTVFDFANAITETARDRTDVAARLSLEETGHRYLRRNAR